MDWRRRVRNPPYVEILEEFRGLSWSDQSRSLMQYILVPVLVNGSSLIQWDKEGRNKVTLKKERTWFE